MSILISMKSYFIIFLRYKYINIILFKKNIYENLINKYLEI